jgi:hypothetical protein
VAGSSVSPSAMTARSMAFCSSRMLPGHDIHQLGDRFRRQPIFLPTSRATRSTKWCAS